MKSPDAALLAILRRAEMHCPGGELAAELHISLAELESRIRNLLAAGFEIEAKPGLGYRLLGSPDRLIADDLAARLGPTPFVRDLVVFEETDSTNDCAARLGREGAAAGIVIFAERQNAGRGRFGRRWESVSHLGLWFSILLRPTLPLAHWPRMTTCAAVAIASAIERLLPVRVELKWPNDLFINGKKIAGILMETGRDPWQESFAVLGIGINANHSADDFAPELMGRASSLGIAAGLQVDRTALAVSILQELERCFGQLADGFALILSEAARRSSLLGRWVELQAGSVRIEGMAEALDPEGHLLVRDFEGRLHCLSAGEVTMLNPPRAQP